MEHLQYDAPDKVFHPLSVNLTCMDMKVTTLMDVYNDLLLHLDIYDCVCYTICVIS